MFKKLLCFIVLIGVGFSYADIVFDKKTKTFLLSSENSSYAFCINKNGFPLNLYWGGKLNRIADVPNEAEVSFVNIVQHRGRAIHSRYEYPPYFDEYTREPALKLLSPDVAVNLKYVEHTIDGDSMRVRLDSVDASYSVILHYEIEPEFDLIKRSVEFKNNSQSDIVLENFFSAQWNLPRAQPFRLTWLEGDWGAESKVHREFLKSGEKVLESRTGSVGHHYFSFMAIDNGTATEDNGEVRFCTLMWSGNWKFIAERDAFGMAHILGGLNNFDFKKTVKAGQSEKTPVFVGGFTKSGFNGMTRKIRKWHEAKIMPDNFKDKVPPVVFNTYACIRRADVTEKNVLALIPLAAKMGIEMFVIDAGWQTAMGDWTLDKKKFPAGFKAIREAVEKNGMRLGLWIEFERLDANSETRKLHPDWAIDDKKHSYLDLSREDVYQHCYNAIATLIREQRVQCIKLDFNRYLEIPQVENRREMREKYIKNFYRLFTALSKEFPDIYFENCASGNQRGDLEMDKYFVRANRSDNQDPLDILRIHEGYTYLHPSKSAGGGCHISDGYTYFINKRTAPMQFMAYVGSMGWLSVGLRLDQISDEVFNECAEYVKLFKKIRHIVARGEMYRLARIDDDKFYAFEFVLPDKSEALVFTFATALSYAEPLRNVKVQGLDHDAVYSITRYGDPAMQTAREKFCNKADPKIRDTSGLGLLESGLRIQMNGDLDSRIFHIKRK